MSFTPAMDTRYSKFEVVSHDGLHIESIAVNEPYEILRHAQNVDVVGIDEVQFMDESIILAVLAPIPDTLVNALNKRLSPTVEKPYNNWASSLTM